MTKRPSRRVTESKQASSVQPVEARERPTGAPEDLGPEERGKNQMRTQARWMRATRATQTWTRRMRVMMTNTEEEGKDCEDEGAEAREEVLQPPLPMALPPEVLEAGLQRTRCQMWLRIQISEHCLSEAPREVEEALGGLSGMHTTRTT